jgi:hypothetical protein
MDLGEIEFEAEDFICLRTGTFVITVMNLPDVVRRWKYPE